MTLRYVAPRRGLQWAMPLQCAIGSALLLLVLLAQAQPRAAGAASPSATPPRTVLVLGDSLSAA